MWEAEKYEVDGASSATVAARTVWISLNWYEAALLAINCQFIDDRDSPAQQWAWKHIFPEMYHNPDTGPP